MTSSTSTCPSCASGSKWHLADCQQSGEHCTDQSNEAWTTSARHWKFARGCTTLKSPKTKRMTALLRWKDKLQSLLEWRTSTSMLWKTLKRLVSMASFPSCRILSWWRCFLTSLEPLESVKRSAMALWRRDWEGRPTTSSAMALKSTESAMVKSKAFRKAFVCSIDRSIAIPNTTCTSIAKVVLLMLLAAQIIGSEQVRGKRQNVLACCHLHEALLGSCALRNDRNVLRLLITMCKSGSCGDAGKERASTLRSVCNIGSGTGAA